MDQPDDAAPTTDDEWPEEFGGGPAPKLVRTGNAKLTRNGKRKV